MLVEDEELASPAKTEIGCSAVDDNSAKQYASRRPNVDSIATSTVHISVCIALDTIWNTDISEGEQTSIDQEWLARICLDIERVSVESQ